MKQNESLSRREFLAAGSAAIGTLREKSMTHDAAAGARRSERPNFVVVYCDDLGYGDLGCYGSPDVRTPHLDALAAGGVRFTNWYSNSPVCSPSRAALLTGCYPARAGVTEILGGKRGSPGLPPSRVTLADALKRRGYRTALFGKWHLGLAEGCRPNSHGFDEFYGFMAG
jgi:arylsulfatase A-like enzyme